MTWEGEQWRRVIKRIRERDKIRAAVAIIEEEKNEVSLPVARNEGDPKPPLERIPSKEGD